MENLSTLRSINTSDHHSPVWSPAPSSLEENAYNFQVLGPAYTRTLRIGLLTLMIVTSLLGNVAVIFSICLPGCRKLRRIQVLFLNLAVADLLVCLFTMTSQLIWECMGREWVAGSVFCPIFKVLQTFTMVCSNYLIVSIALDRFIAVVFPLRRGPNTKNYLLGAWLMSLLPSLPSAYIFHLYNDPSGSTFCVAKFYTDHLSINQRRVYMALILTSVFMIPISIIIVVYTRIVRVVWTRQKPFSDNCSSMESVVSSCTSNKEKGIHSNNPKAMVKTFWMTAIVVISFLVCALPYFVLEFYIAFGDSKNLNEDVVALLGIMSAANSSINPFVYLISNSRWCSKKNTNVKCSCFLPKHMKKEYGKAVMSTSV